MSTCKHFGWQMIFASGKVWVCCTDCSARFQFGIEQNGTPFVGKVPDKYR